MISLSSFGNSWRLAIRVLEWYARARWTATVGFAKVGIDSCGLSVEFPTKLVSVADPVSPVSDCMYVTYTSTHILFCTHRPDNSYLLGPDSPSWITVTEQGIRQSFDLTRVMFCRGNITEKIRFGKLVQRGEIILDLYGGIGYFTLPALVHGQAEYLYACEWNPRAVEGLLHNLRDNKVMERATVYQGDCRVVAKENNLVDRFDRVSLGLLPSSEGGWRTAVRAVRNATGGWLHVHANVPAKEVDAWSVWLCCCLRDLAVEEKKPKDWVVLCKHVEKVKSFAPTVNHYVADVFVGPTDRLPLNVELKPGTAGVLKTDKTVELCPAVVTPSSCALSPDGVLHQNWMR